MGVLIRGGEVVTASERFHADVWVQGEVVVALVAGVEGMFEPDEDDVVLDASGCYVIPGGVDVNTSLELELDGTVTCDDFASGTVAAICGGTTTIIDRVVPRPGEHLCDALDRRQAQAEGQAACDYSVHAAVRRWDAEVAEEVEAVRYRGVGSFELSLAGPGIDDAGALEVLRRLAEVGAYPSVRTRNGTLYDALAATQAARGETSAEFHAACEPVEAEAEATGRAIDLAALAGTPIHVGPVSAALALERVHDGQARRRPLSAETCPHYLLLTDDLLERGGVEAGRYVVSPPLRPRSDQEALWAALASGTVQVVSSRHRPYPAEAKQRDDFRRIPPGVTGIEERLDLLHSYGVLAERITLNRWVDACCTAPAKLFGLYPRKGTVSVGADADLLVYDPQVEGVVDSDTHHSACDYNVWEGFVTRGAPRFVLVRGRVVYESGHYTGDPGSGRFVHRGPMQAA